MKLGLREQRKQEKRQRIRAAVRALFSKHGFETATLREIAKRAHVALGTLFNYAEDKRDLVFLIFNEELAAVADEALRAAKTKNGLLDQLMAICRPHYLSFAKNPALSRILLKDMTFYSEGKQAAQYLRNRGHLISGMQEKVTAAQRAGQIRSDEDAALIARHFFLVFAGALRWWIAGRNPHLQQGLAEVKRFFELQIDGLRAAPLSAKATGSPRRTRIAAAAG